MFTHKTFLLLLLAGNQLMPSTLDIWSGEMSHLEPCNLIIIPCSRLHIISTCIHCCIHHLHGHLSVSPSASPQLLIKSMSAAPRDFAH